MGNSILGILILGILVILSIALLWFQKKQQNQPMLEGFDVSDGVLLDFDNPNLSSDTFWGDIPQNASISIFKKAELKGLTANPDAIPVADGDPKTGKGAGPQLTVTDIPDLPPPADDIESQLNAAVNEPDTPDDVTEGFYVSKPPPKPAAASPLVATAAAQNQNTATALAVAQNPTGAAIGAVTAGIGLSYDTSTPQGQAMQAAQAQAQGQAQTVAEKLKNKVLKKMKAT